MDSIPIPDALRADLIETINPPIVAFHNSPGRHQRRHNPRSTHISPLCHPFRPAVNARNKPEVTVGLVPLHRKKSSTHLHRTRKSAIS
jgi:hypothetical protein